MASGQPKLGIWRKISIAGKAVFDPRTPLTAKLLLLAGLLYGVSPIDLIPDLLPLLGLTDDSVVILVAIIAFLRFSRTVRKKLMEA